MTESSGTPTPLTPRELAVLRLAAEGRTNAEIAAELGRAEPTIAGHFTSAMRRLRARSRAHAVAILDDAFPGWRERSV